MKILHTSDWHIGRTLHGRKRYEEFEAFLAWLSETIKQEQVDVLLVAGDVFDTSSPSNRAQGLYYRFLCRVALSSCRHIVVISGNHDSPSFIDAPKDLLRELHVNVVGAVSENIEDEIILLRQEDGSVGLIVCAVPYLRDKDIRMSEAGESAVDKEKRLLEGIRIHYAEVFALAEQKRAKLGKEIPIVAMGHIFTAGGKTVEDDGVRELYVGSLAHVDSSIFPSSLSYLALGHLHVPQRVRGSEIMRYSGSPIPMGFGEAKQEKSVCLVEFIGTQAEPRLIKVPVFQKLERIKGNLSHILTRISELSAMKSKVWLEVIYEGDEVVGDLRKRLDEAVSDQIEITRVKNTRLVDRVLGESHDNETLDDLSIYDVFERCMLANEVSDEQKPELLRAYKEAVMSLDEDDTRAE